MNVAVNGKRVVVAGGSRGIGRSTALAFAAAGAHVSICAHGPDALEKSARRWRPSGHRARDFLQPCQGNGDRALQNQCVRNLAALQPRRLSRRTA
jgi:NAD(P)-dependent dehydrogenase (short-subunit alcohol dehydrogenase family)